jgi:FAD/FMN-containing dehydrogenase/Fe-S oxidoreductase
VTAVLRSGPAGTKSGRAPSDEALASLERGLRRVLHDGLRSDIGTRALYASDASNYRLLPAMVAFPESIDQLASVVGLCGEAGVALTMRGAGTSIAGNAVGPGVVVETTRHLNAVLDLDPESRTAVVQPGAVLDDVNRRAAIHGLRFGPDPSTHSRCSIGGMIGNNACGAHSIRWGTTAANVLSLEVIRSDGRRVLVGSPAAERAVADSGFARDRAIEGRVAALVAENVSLLRSELPPWPRRVSGYALDWLLPERGFDLAKSLVGSEGTCAVVASATLRLIRPPAARALLVLGFADDVEAAAAVPAVLEAEPLTVEGITAELLGGDADRPSRELLPPGRAWLLIEAGGDDAGEAADHARRLALAADRRLGASSVRLHVDALPQAALWRVREDGAGRATRLPDGSPAWPGFEDAAVPPERLAAYLSGFRSLLGEHALKGTTYGHFGEGCIHVRIGFGLDRPGGVDRFAAFMDEAADLVVAHGGTLSGEHGDGRARSALLSKMFSPELLALFRQFRAVWDGIGVLNPGVIVDPYPISTGLRAALPTLVQVHSKLAFEADGGDFRAAVQRCVGVGACISRSTNALMCPSYRATGDERDSTRGRARVLQEMLAGSLAADGWRSTEVRDALDLCLSCKGCLSDCPTGVDMAAYKSEFLYHHYAGRLRPRSHYALGSLPLWLRLSRRSPRIVNWAIRTRPIARLLAAVAGMDPARTIPPLAGRTFVRSFRPRPPRRPTRGRIVLWPDTFNNYLTPGVAEAASRVLAAAGFEVAVPRSPVCCGLTWITTGQLDQARRVLRRTLSAPSLQGDEQVAVLEPSCAAALRRDVPDLLPDDARATAFAKRVTTLAELLAGVGFATSRGERVEALMQPHCHQQAVLGVGADREVLDRSGVEIATMLHGCCGLAGNFGAETEHRDVSRAVAGLELLPALAAADPGALIMADGFSCRTQIAYLTGRRARHLAEVLADRLDDLPEERAAGLS